MASVPFWGRWFSENKTKRFFLKLQECLEEPLSALKTVLRWILNRYVFSRDARQRVLWRWTLTNSTWLEPQSYFSHWIPAIKRETDGIALCPCRYSIPSKGLCPCTKPHSPPHSTPLLTKASRLEHPFGRIKKNWSHYQCMGVRFHFMDYI